MKILAVDDNPFMLDFLPAILKEADFPDVTVAASGKEALRILEAAAEPFDCLLLDIVMPEMDGIKLCRKVREMRTYRTTPIIMLTLKTDTASIERAFAAGASDYIFKPFEVREIARRLRVTQRILDSTEVALRLDPQMMLLNGERGQHVFSLEDPVYVLGIHQLVPPFTLGNYLSQLSRKNLDFCHVFCAQVEDITTLYSHCTSREYVMAIAAGARAIGRVVDRPQLLMAHIGSGTLLGILTGDGLPEWPHIEDEVQNELQKLTPWGEEPRDLSIGISLGRPIQPNAHRTQRVKNTFDRAIGRLVERQKTMHKASLGHKPAVSSAR